MYVGESTGEDYTSRKAVKSNKVFHLHGIFVKNHTDGIFTFFLCSFEYELLCASERNN